MSEVTIEEATTTLSGGYIPWLKEKYPFSKLTNSVWANDDKTAVTGPSFLIPKTDNPPSVLAAGRKRLKHCLFITRKVSVDGDIRVWLHPDSPLPANRPLPVGGFQAAVLDPKVKMKVKQPQPA
jgi:hypothetical protein